MGEATRKENAAIKSVSIEWATVDVGHGSVVVYYDPNVPYWLSLIFDHVYISSLALLPCKSIFKDEFYSRFVTRSLLNFGKVIILKVLLFF
jgi:hypothetical protein